MGLYRRLNFGGIEFIEVATVLVKLSCLLRTMFRVFANDDSFVCYHSPAQRLDTLTLWPNACTHGCIRMSVILRLLLKLKWGCSMFYVVLTSFLAVILFKL